VREDVSAFTPQNCRQQSGKAARIWFDSSTQVENLDRDGLILLREIIKVNYLSFDHLP